MALVNFERNLSEHKLKNQIVDGSSGGFKVGMPNFSVPSYGTREKVTRLTLSTAHLESEERNEGKSGSVQTLLAVFNGSNNRKLEKIYDPNASLAFYYLRYFVAGHRLETQIYLSLEVHF